jgi:hypothetical protein
VLSEPVLISEERETSSLVDFLPGLCRRQVSMANSSFSRRFPKTWQGTPQAHHQGRLSGSNLRLFTRHVQELVFAPYSDGHFNVS